MRKFILGRSRLIEPCLLQVTAFTLHYVYLHTNLTEPALQPDLQLREFERPAGADPGPLRRRHPVPVRHRDQPPMGGRRGTEMWSQVCVDTVVWTWYGHGVGMVWICYMVIRGRWTKPYSFITPSHLVILLVAPLVMHPHLVYHTYRRTSSQERLGVTPVDTYQPLGCVPAPFLPMCDANPQQVNGIYNQFVDSISHAGKNLSWGPWAITKNDPFFRGLGYRDTGESEQEHMSAIGMHACTSVD